MSRCDNGAERRGLGWDWLIIIACVAFAGTSFLVDPLSSFGVPMRLDSDNPIVRSTAQWAHRTDPLWLENPPMLRVQTALSAFVYGPFYVLLAVALWRRARFIRVPALVVAGALGSNVVIYVIGAFVGYHVESPLLFLAVNLPYFILAAGLVVRFRHAV